jgi:two-component system chemotaxis response regulator CheY
MPKMDGYTFLRRLRSLDIHQAPAIMVSTEAEAHDQEAAFMAGANIYLHKPARPDELRRYVALLLGEVAE